MPQTITSETLFTSLNELSSLTRELSLSYFNKQNFSTTLKLDQTPVTEADLAIENLIRNYIKKNFPDHGIIGEEYENYNPTADYQWAIDPIDGTQNFAAGIPTYLTMIGVVKNDTPIAGMMDHPAINLKVIAAKNLGCYANDRRIVINDDNLDPKSPLIKSSIITCSTPECFAHIEESSTLDLLSKTHGNLRMYYDFLGETLAAIGKVEAALCFGACDYEIPTIQIITEESGAKFVCVKRYKNSKGGIWTASVSGKPKVVDYLLEKLRLNESL